MSGNKKVGLFFGSFNPVHVGHLIIANFFVENTDLDEVWFVISPQNPLKNKSSLLDEKNRYYMVQIAIEDNARLKASNIEFHMQRPSYTIHTLAVLTEKYPEFQFVLLMGSDNLQSFHKWKNHREIIDNYSIYVYKRPATKATGFDNHPSVKFFEAPLMQISSSYIRKQIKAGKSVEYLLTPKVLEYVTSMHAYEK